MAGEEPADVGLHPVDRRARGRPLVLRRGRRTDRLADGIPRQPEPMRDLLDRNPFGKMQAPNLCPIFHVEQLLPPRRVRLSQAWARVIESADQGGRGQEKPGSLSGGEWELVRLHPYYTERIVGRVPALA